MNNYFKYSLFLIIFMIIGIVDAYSYICTETSSYTLYPMGWRVRTFRCEAVHPSTGAIIIWNKRVIDDGSGGTIFEDEIMDGKIAISDELVSNNSDYLIYPNPTSQFIDILIQNSKGRKIELTLYDLNSNKIASFYENVLQTDKIHLILPHIASGNYILVINDGFNFISKSISIIN